MDRGFRTLIDASVAVKWFVNEEHRNLALKLRDMHVSGSVTLIAPDLLVYEVANALRYNPYLNVGDVERAVESIYKLHIELYSPTIDLMTDAARKAEKYNITFYDAAYLSLAERETCRMITADKKLYDKVKNSKLALLIPSEELNELISKLTEKQETPIKLP